MFSAMNLRCKGACVLVYKWLVGFRELNACAGCVLKKCVSMYHFSSTGYSRVVYLCSGVQLMHFSRFDLSATMR